MGRWDLTEYSGLEVKVVAEKTNEGKDGKVYTLVLKGASSSASSENEHGLVEDDDDDDDEGEDNEPTDQTQPTSSLSYEAKFSVPKSDVEGDALRIWLPWNEFKATYRGRRVEDGRPWTGAWVARVGFMMRRYEMNRLDFSSLPLSSLFSSFISFYFPSLRPFETFPERRGGGLGGWDGGGRRACQPQFQTPPPSHVPSLLL